MTDTHSLGAADAVSDETTAKFRRLRKLNTDLRLKANKHDRAIMLICACLDEEFDTRSRIVGVLGKIGFDRRHVAIILNEGTGCDPKRHWWQVDNNGRYSLHSEASLPHTD